MRKGKCFIAPSILSADFAELGSQIRDAERGGADWIHVDVMDGHFVPNLTMGPVIVKCIRPITKLPLDCHLMVQHPQKWIQPFREAGADWITVHIEAASDPLQCLRSIRASGAKAGISLNPATELKAIESVLDEVDLVLVMSVVPGFGGQKFMDSAYEKIKRLKILQKDRDFLIEVDGGVTVENIKKLHEAGAEVFVAGSSVFGRDSIKKALKELKREIE